MKKVFTVLSAILFSISLWAQAPQSFSYQAVVRGVNNELVANKNIGIKISLLQDSENGIVAYAETHTPTANDNGLVSIAIGAGTKVSGDFATIDWSKGPYFVKTEMDPTGGTIYSLTSVSQLLSVPYALYAANSLPGPKGDKGEQGLPGKDGVDGKNGVDGKDGLPGAKGETGAQGLPGKDGVDGKNGTDGKYGAQGPVGPKGDAGAIGAQGSKGDKGDKGEKGLDGKDEQKLSVSATGDTLYLTNGNFVIIPGLSTANSKPTSGYGQNISDVEGNLYKTVYIGTQQWMAENLKTAKYNDGTIIPCVTGLNQWVNLKTGGWCNYNNSDSLGKIYGKLYNWYAVNPITNGNKNVCPTGWHVPTDNEWTVLTDYLGGLSLAGGKLKEVGTRSWNSPNKDATNMSLFTGLPGGCSLGGDYSSIVNYGFWWSATEYLTLYAWQRNLYSNSGTANRGTNGKRDGLSVRCIKE
jgi:uncharacterized protein (TIGR02145 family)